MIKPLKVLIVEDNEDDAAMLVRALQRGGFEPIYTRVDNAADLRAALSESSWEIIICDHAMPQFDSFAALTIVKETGFDLPFIVVSGVIGEEVAVAIMKAGAHDYLMKDKLLRLVPAIERELQEAEGRRQRRQAEEALRTSEERFRGLIENSPSAIFLNDREHRFRIVNKRFEQWYGVAEADVLGKTSYDLFPQEYADVYVSQDQEVLETGTAIERELIVPFADGTLHPVLVTKYPVFDARGHPVGVGTINSDMTARKQAEDELRRQRDMLDVTLSSIGDAVIATDTHSRITFFNRVAEGLTGWPQQDALGRPLDEVFRIVHEQTLQPAENPVARVMREGVVVGLANHTALITRQNQMIPIADSGAPILSSSGILQGVVLVFRDIAEQKQLEEVLLRARKIESVGVLAGGIAHDFNNLLTGIMGNVSLAMMLAGQEEQVVARLTEAENACRRATKLTHQLLTFSKGGAPVRQTVSIAELLTESATFALRGSNVRGVFTIAEDLWPADVDAGQINQVLHNVVLNAAQAMPDGGTVQVQADNVWLNAAEVPPLHEGRYVKITVHDQGRGISAEILPNIFDPYFTTKEHGSGLGLATAYAIITKHDGFITVASEVGAGATFVMYLPGSQHDVMPAQDIPDTPLVGSGRILVVDDEEAIRDLLSTMLTRIGYEVDCVRDGAEAIDVYQNAQAEGRPYTAVILDITIPGGMGGLEALAPLRAIDPQAKVLISSGYANNPVMADFQQYGFNGVIAKPYTVQRLHDVLQHVIRV
jgi:PAS domain S-box-containing protein